MVVLVGGWGVIGQTGFHITYQPALQWPDEAENPPRRGAARDAMRRV